jgi:transcriptional regulator with XRE-family HTH domain
MSQMDDKWFKLQQKKVGKTADQIAEVLGRDRSVVSKILSGKQRMSLEWAKAFSDALDVPLATVLEKAGVASQPVARQVAPGFGEGDAAAFIPRMGSDDKVDKIATALGGARPGVDVWRVNSRSMALAGYLEDDFFLLDTHQAERTRAGDVVVAQIYQRNGKALTVLRRLEPPVLVAASLDPADMRVYVVDGENVVIRGKVTASWRA